MAVISTNTTKAGLDEIFDSFFDAPKKAGEVRADDGLFFRQDNTEWLTIQIEESMGPGDYDEVAIDEEVPEATVRTGNKTNIEVFEYDKDVPIPQRYQEASSHYGTVSNWVKQLGIRGRTTRDKFAFRRSYGDAFSGVTTPDGSAFIADSHTSLNGDTIDNLETGVLTPANLETVVRSLRLQKAQDGDDGSFDADGLLVPIKLHPDAVEITKSELKAGTAQNELNYWSFIYPGMMVGFSKYLDSTYNTLNSNANTSYFVVAREHSVTRAVRIPLQKEYIGPEVDRRRRAFYRARFSERVYVGTWGGVVASSGTV